MGCPEPVPLRTHFNVIASVYQKDLTVNNYGMKYSVGAKTWISLTEDSIFNA
jgi:hypothetical protein